MAKIYHEKQSRMLCGVHSLNNALQQKLFDKTKFDEICLKLDSNKVANSYRNIFGLGNYDVNVLMHALNEEGYSLMWLNATKEINESYLNPNNIEAYLVNKPQPFKVLNFNLPIWGKHWISFKYINDTETPGYYNLDSKLYDPEFISSDTESFYQHLNSMRVDKEVYIFAIVKKEHDVADVWHY